MMKTMQDTKSQIIEIARHLFAEHGFDGVSVRTICNQAGCNVSAISYYFGSKEELFHCTLVDDTQRRIKNAQGILTAPENAEDFKTKLKMFLTNFFEDSCENSCTIRIIARDMKIITGNENVHAYFKKIPDTLALFFKQAQDKNILKSHFDPRSLVDFALSPYFIHVLFSSTKHYFDINDAQMRQKFVDQHLSLICDGYLL